MQTGKKNISRKYIARHRHTFPAAPASYPSSINGLRPGELREEVWSNGKSLWAGRCIS